MLPLLLALLPGQVLDDMDAIRFRSLDKRGKLELVEGKIGKAVKFSVEKDAPSVFFASEIRGKAEWDKAAGFSFLVKGDGTDATGCLHVVHDDDFGVRYDFCFPTDSTEWRRVKVAWEDFAPLLPGAKSRPLGLKGNAPSKIGTVWFGKWWYWRDYPAQSFTIDDLRLEAKIERDTKDYRPAGGPLDRTLAKLEAGEPVTIMTIGDSLTDARHWANRKVSWPELLKKQLEAKYKGKVTIVNPAIGGTQLRQNVAMLPRRLGKGTPDLVTFAFGYNDWDAGMRGPQFQVSYEDAIDRTRRLTKGASDVLVLSTAPALKRWDTMKELAAACRSAAKARNAGLADVEAAFHATGEKDRAKLFVDDEVHLGPAGHEAVAKAVREAIEKR